jgi:hypothetical protein
VDLQTVCGTISWHTQLRPQMIVCFNVMEHGKFGHSRGVSWIVGSPDVLGAHSDNVFTTIAAYGFTYIVSIVSLVDGSSPKTS